MDNRYYSSVIEEMQPFFDEHGFSAREDGSFLSENRSVKIEYSEEKQMYLLIRLLKENTVRSLKQTMQKNMGRNPFCLSRTGISFMTVG